MTTQSLSADFLFGVRFYHISTPVSYTHLHEIYLHNGIRVTIYAGDRTKPEQEVMVFRKYLFKDLSFENLAELGTIPREAIPLFRDMIRIGFNILIGGPVRTARPWHS